MSRYQVQDVSVGDAGLTARPAVVDTTTGRTIRVYRRPERHLAEAYAAKLNPPADLRDATPAEIAEEPTFVLRLMVDGSFGELSDVTIELARQELARRNSPSHPFPVDA